MKFFSKLAAILAALMLACAFVACSNDGGSSDDSASTGVSPSTGTLIATFASGSGYTVYQFYSDNRMSIVENGGSPDWFTYTGNPAATSGTVTISTSRGPYTLTINGNTASDGNHTYTRQ